VGNELGIEDDQFRLFGITHSYAQRKMLDATWSNQRVGVQNPTAKIIFSDLPLRQ
jgi:hypothetical protein